MAIFSVTPAELKTALAMVKKCDHDSIAMTAVMSYYTPIYKMTLNELRICRKYHQHIVDSSRELPDDPFAKRNQESYSRRLKEIDQEIEFRKNAVQDINAGQTKAHGIGRY